MPTINKPKREKKKYKRHFNRPKTGKSLEIAKIYNSMGWVKLRNAYFQAHPLCEKCLENGITKAAEEVHHIKPIGTGKDELEMKSLAYDPKNLKSLCRECHHEIHDTMNKVKKRKKDE